MSPISFAQALAAKKVISRVASNDATASGLIKNDRARALIQSGNIVGCGVGYLDPSDESKGAAVVCYALKTLVEAETLALYQGVDVEIDSTVITVPVRVERSGTFHSHAGTVAEHAAKSAGHERTESGSLSSDYRGRVRPVPGGYSVGTPEESGTAGLIVINDPEHTQLYILSNNHVLDKDNSNGFTENIQPGGADNGVSGQDQVGRLDRFVPLSNTRDNFIDAATSIPLSNSTIDPRYGRNRITVPGHYVQYSVGWKFFKAGRTTGDVSGIVDSVHTDVTVDYGPLGNLGTISFKDQSIVKQVQGQGPVSLPGDSGSVWLRDIDNRACAVNFAGSDGSFGIAFPIEWFMVAFKCLVAEPNAAAGDAVSLRIEAAAQYSSAVTPEFATLLASLVQCGR